jgi:hypothetical protein
MRGARPSAICHPPSNNKQTFHSRRYSDRNDFTGFIIAALIAWKLTVITAMNVAIAAAAKKIHQPIVMR